MNNKKIGTPEIDQQVQETIELLAQVAPGDAREHYLAGIAAGMRYASAAAPTAPAAPEGDRCTA